MKTTTSHLNVVFFSDGRSSPFDYKMSAVNKQSAKRFLVSNLGSVRLSSSSALNNKTLNSNKSKNARRGGIGNRKASCDSGGERTGAAWKGQGMSELVGEGGLESSESA